MSQTDPWAALARATGAAGLVGIVLLFVPIIAITTLCEPEFDATREEVAAFFRNTAESSWADVANTVAVFGLVALTWFMVGLCLLLRRAEGDPPWRSTLRSCSGHCSRLISSQTRACRPRATAAPTSTRVWLTLLSTWGTSGLPTPGSAWVPSPRSAAGPFSRQDLPAVVGLADGGQRHRVGTESVCLDNEYLAAAVRTLLGLVIAVCIRLLRRPA